jgi:hypothetical protein
VATSVLANANRNAEARPEPFTASDFMPWRNAGQAAQDDEPVLLDDPVAQSDLIRAALFGIAPS